MPSDRIARSIVIALFACASVSLTASAADRAPSSPDFETACAENDANYFNYDVDPMPVANPARLLTAMS